MHISVKEAAYRLTELAHRAEKGEEIILTQEGHSPLQVISVNRKALTSEERRKVVDEVRAMAPPRTDDQPSAARSQDFLYDEDGLPG